MRLAQGVQLQECIALDQAVSVGKFVVVAGNDRIVVALVGADEVVLGMMLADLEMWRF